MYATVKEKCGQRIKLIIYYQEAEVFASQY